MLLKYIEGLDSITMYYPKRKHFFRYFISNLSSFLFLFTYKTKFLIVSKHASKISSNKRQHKRYTSWELYSVDKILSLKILGNTDSLFPNSSKFIQFCHNQKEKNEGFISIYLLFFKP